MRGLRGRLFGFRHDVHGPVKGNAALPNPVRQHQAGRADDIGMVAEEYGRPAK